MAPTSSPSNPTRSPTLDASDTDAGAHSHPSLPPPLQATSSSKDFPCEASDDQNTKAKIRKTGILPNSLPPPRDLLAQLYATARHDASSSSSSSNPPASVLVSGLTVWGVHYMQEREREVMYRGVERDEERQAEKKRKRLLDLQINQEKEAAYQKIQPTAAAASSGTSSSSSSSASPPP
ncbi:uncharacterized protein UDID_20250 [Ustilago sp. UG-2017a]|nr:uncharacterized protein UDID_20250 [Ustilago sp. UG-2017a]